MRYECVEEAGVRVRPCGVLAFVATERFTVDDAHLEAPGVLRIALLAHAEVAVALEPIPHLTLTLTLTRPNPNLDPDPDPITLTLTLTLTLT